jgi:hypothetical protein
VENHELREMHRPRAIENRAMIIGFLFEREKLR